MLQNRAVGGMAVGPKFKWKVVLEAKGKGLPFLNCKLQYIETSNIDLPSIGVKAGVPLDSANTPEAKQDRNPNTTMGAWNVNTGKCEKTTFDIPDFPSLPQRFAKGKGTNWKLLIEVRVTSGCPPGRTLVRRILVEIFMLGAFNTGGVYPMDWEYLSLPNPRYP
ncbi:MAG: hypothetical protein H6718_00135 [Polyangiaceae bacterium]|nr:hypothetical protein [Polyangiaceae bacterium]